MKYAVVSFIILILSGWSWVKPDISKQPQQVKINGKVFGLQGKVLIKIEDNYFNLATSDRFSLLVNTTPTQKKLSMEITVQPKNQNCELSTSKKDIKTIYLKVSCHQLVAEHRSNKIAAL